MCQFSYVSLRGLCLWSSLLLRFSGDGLPRKTFSGANSDFLGGRVSALGPFSSPLSFPHLDRLGLSGCFFFLFSLPSWLLFLIAMGTTATGTYLKGACIGFIYLVIFCGVPGEELSHLRVVPRAATLSQEVSLVQAAATDGQLIGLMCVSYPLWSGMLDLSVNAVRVRAVLGFFSSWAPVVLFAMV